MLDYFFFSHIRKDKFFDRGVVEYKPAGDYMTIYIDVIFIENLILNYIMILSVAIILKKDKKHIRFVLGSLIGSLYTVITYITGVTIYTNLFFKFILSIVIVYVSFYPQTIKKMWKDLLYFYLVTFTFGGVAFGFIYIVKPQDIFMRSGIELETIVIGFVVAFILIFLSFKVIKKRLKKDNMYSPIEVVLDDFNIETIAMIDTGNFLKEPISGKPVIILEHTLLYEIIPKQILNNLENIIGGDFSNVPEEIRLKYITRLKMIPFSSLGKQNGMLVGIKADKVKIFENESENIIEKKDIILGIYNKSLTKRGEYRALVGIEIFE